MATLTSKFDVLDKVVIDNSDVSGVIIGILWRSSHVEYEISWFTNGDMVTHWVIESRLTIAD